MENSLNTAIFLFVASAATALAINPSEITAEKFLRCNGKELSSHGTDTMTMFGRSALECAVGCSQLSSCHGVNVCPTGTKREVTCVLISDFNPGGCNALETASSPQCYFMQKLEPAVDTTEAATTRTHPTTETTTMHPTTEAESTMDLTTEVTTMCPTTEATTKEAETTELVCQNGGTPNGDACMCPMEYGGRTCHRLVRDCSEVFENGYTEKSFSGMFTIQPITAPNPFQVRCHFEWGVGITYTFERQEWSNFDTKTWSEIRDGFGDPSSEEYFIGLDNLHHLSTQGGYELHIYFNYWVWSHSGSSFYQNFSIASEAERYRLSYANFYTVPERPAGNGFPLSGSGPVLFSPGEQDTNGCADLRGAAGWYDAGCSTSNALFANHLQWRLQDGAQVNPNDLEFNMVRRTPFYG